MENSGSADGKKWDKMFDPDIHADIARIRFRMLRKEDQTMDNYYRVINWYSSVQFKYCVLPNGEIWKVGRGQTSGNFLTLDDNSFCHELHFICVFLKHAPSLSFDELALSYGKFWKHIILGDDILFQTPLKFEVFIKDFDLFLEHETTGGYSDFSVNRFCGQYIVPYRGTYVAVPDRYKMISSLCWTKRKLSRVQKLVRLLQIRLHSYFIPELTSFISSYVADFLSRHTLSEEELAFLRCNTLEDSQIEKLYTGFEGTTLKRVHPRKRSLRWLTPKRPEKSLDGKLRVYPLMKSKLDSISPSPTKLQLKRKSRRRSLSESDVLLVR